jgi:hypothetical protein
LPNFLAERVEDAETLFQPERFLVLTEIVTQFNGHDANVTHLLLQFTKTRRCGLKFAENNQFQYNGTVGTTKHGSLYSRTHGLSKDRDFTYVIVSG